MTRPPARCPRCAASTVTGDRFCERCGAPLAGTDEAASGSTPACAACGSEIGQDGYCLTCGLLRTAVDPDPDPDHTETDLGAVAGVSDRGLVHRTNEDGMGLAVLPRPGVAGVIGVVCDGVSTAPGSGPAAAAAARVATAVLTERLRAWTARSPTPRPPAAQSPTPGSPAPGPPVPPVPQPPSTGAVMADALREAARAAHRAVGEGAAACGLAPACTFLAAVAVDATLVVGWLGDSRAYLIDTAGARRLTADDTAAAEAARAGLLPPERAERGPGAHTITRWLGSGQDSVDPHVAEVAFAPPARVVLCSDGLWNYTSAPEVLADHARAAGGDASTLEVARHLTGVALRAGGADNVTVIVFDLPGSA